MLYISSTGTSCKLYAVKFCQLWPRLKIISKGLIYMKTLEEIKNLMMGKSVITNLADLLRTNDEEFAESEKKYLAAVERLRSELPGDFSPSLDEYLTACETDVISVVAYAGYLGFRVNLENFHPYSVFP